MIDYLSSIKDLFEESNEMVYFIPSLIFGYLYSLNGDSIFFWIAALWIAALCLTGGMGKVDASTTFDQKVTCLAIGLVIIHALFIGPLAFLAALNNILPEQQELHPIQWTDTDIPFNYIFAEITQGPLATNDSTLVALCLVQLAAHVYLYVGPVIGGLILDGIIRAVELVSHWRS